MANKSYLLNAFSVNMLESSGGERLRAAVTFLEVSLEEARRALTDGFISAVGHPATAQVLTERLGLEVPCDRVNVTLSPGDFALLAQVNLPRLSEGQVLTSEQLAEAPVRYFLVKIESA